MRRFIALFALGVFLVAQPVMAMAGEHGGKEHVGSAPAKEAKMKDADILNGAADELRATRPDLSKELERMSHHFGHKAKATKEHQGT